MPMKDSRSITVEPVVVPDRGVRRYHCGAIDPACPFYSVDVGGISFPRMTELVKTDDQTRETVRMPRPGAFYELTDADVERVKDAIARKVIRWANRDKTKAYILNVREVDGAPNKRYRKIDSDEPLGKFLYMKEVAPELDIKAGDPLVS